MKRFWLIPGLVIFSVSAYMPEFNRAFGEASFTLLKLHQSPRTIAMAGAGTGSASSVLEACDLNPAGAVSDSGVLYIGYGIPYREFEATTPNITWGVPLGKKRLFFNSRFLNFEEQPGRDEYDNPTSDYGAHTLKVQAGIADVFMSVHWGLSFGYALNNIAYANYHTYFFDAGTRYEIFNGLWAGASVSNTELWTSSAYNSRYNNPFPPGTFRAGLAYQRVINSNVSISTAIDARTRNDEKLSFPAGVELELIKHIYLRAGYPFGEPEPAFSFGTGLKWGMFVLDYAFMRHETLSGGHFMNLGIRF